MRSPGAAGSTRDRFGNYLGTAIGPHYFITAKHLGTGPPHFVFHGVNYTIVGLVRRSRQATCESSEVAETLPLYAPLYTRSDELGSNLVVIGRGTQRGEDRVVNGRITRMALRAER